MFPLSHLLRHFVRVGSLKIIDAKGREHLFAGKPGPSVTIRITRPSLYYKLFFNPRIYVGESYMDGGLVCEKGQLNNFLRLYFLNAESFESHFMQRVLHSLSTALRRFQQNNTIHRARRRVAHHYDIGNDFYKLFLDEDMQYSCAVFETQNDSLEQAQLNKKRLIAAKLNLRPGDRVLDIGSGWGGMAMYLASVEDVQCLGVTLSKEQYELANRRAREAGLSDRVRFELKDYRDVDGSFDRIVSVGMFEHVGARHFGEFFAGIGKLLKRDGVALLHSIGRCSPPGLTEPWIQKYIFPGGYTPSLSEVLKSIERKQLWVNDIEVLRLHYAYTAREWKRQLMENYDAVKEMFDERFCRMWEFFLTGVEETFLNDTSMVFQMLISHERDAVPITREFVEENKERLAERGNLIRRTGT